MIIRQLELGIQGEPAMRSIMRKPRRPSRARWWFEQMHEVVEDARDWPSSGPSARVTEPNPAETAPRLPSGQTESPAETRAGNAPVVSGAYRWSFGRIHRLMWE